MSTTLITSSVHCIEDLCKTAITEETASVYFPSQFHICQSDNPSPELQVFDTDQIFGAKFSPGSEGHCNINCHLLRYGCIYVRRYDSQIVWNACTWFSEKGQFWGGGVGVNCRLKPFRNINFGAFLLFMPHDFQDFRILKSLGFEDHCILRM